MAFDARKPGHVALGLAWFVLALGVNTACAGSLALNPVHLSLGAKQPISALTVRNDGDQPAVVQLDVAKWTQAEGKDVYTPTSEILATPPIFTVPPGGSQLVRVGLRRSADAEHELSYRVFLKEIPPPPSPEFEGLRVAVRFDVPVFVAPLTPSARQEVTGTAELRLRAHTAAPSNLVFNITNTGTTHVRVLNLALLSPPKTDPIAAYQGVEYVLSGQNRNWIFKVDALPAAGTSLHIRADTDSGPLEADVALESP